MKKLLTLTITALCSLWLLGCNETMDTASSHEVRGNPGRELVMDSIRAHGGTERWYNNGLLQFRWTYHMSDRGPQAIVDTVQTVDPTNLNVMHEVPGKDIRFGMYEGQYWIAPKGSQFAPPVQFWSLTPYYFIGIPFVFNDENAIFERLSESMAFEGKDYTQVKITYTQEAGDSPDDYYVLLIDPETKLTKGGYYIVTNPLVAPNGPGPEKFLSLDNLIDVDGVLLASGHRTFAMQDGQIGEQMRFTEVSGVKFVPSESVDLSIPSPELILE
ncbi:hypothetical protein QEH59_12900 [Coraliomargarita sp. SDUM461004]|uniref:Lipoprotein n=1 Tax=Thalassobacterium sedimentorum TaxID=3041258 RepID=A0ABU1AKL3_9BACT|nr:hypothetical protein [Coraliomargarita sp. SDUM461004]MDQ8195328.1 hypothetical protein [Coraliomargarita sp. SDUM461004]